MVRLIICSFTHTVTHLSIHPFIHDPPTHPSVFHPPINPYKNQTQNAQVISPPLPPLPTPSHTPCTMYCLRITNSPIFPRPDFLE